MDKETFDVLAFLESRSDPQKNEEISHAAGININTFNRIVKELSDLSFVDNGIITKAGIAALEPYRVKRAIFLAAGTGARLAPITLNTPKPLINVNGEKIIDTLLDAAVAAGIPEMVVVRGHLGEQFDQLLHKYPRIRFVDNPLYNKCNNISSAVCVKELLQNAYVLESDLFLKDRALIRKYEYCSNFLGFPVKRSDDWCLTTDPDGRIISEKLGGENCYQMVGISYWDGNDGAKLFTDLADVFSTPEGKNYYWEQVPLVYRKERYDVRIRECRKDDVTEIDTLDELKEIDKKYNAL